MTQKNDVQSSKEVTVVKEVVTPVLKEAITPVVKEATTPAAVETPNPDEEPQTGNSSFPRRMNDSYLLMRSSIEVSMIDPAIREMAARYGFNAEKMNEGKQALDDFDNATAHCSDCEAELFAKKNAFAELFARTDEKIVELRMKARIAFKLKPEVFKLLGLQLDKSKTFGQWSAGSGKFIERLISNPECLEELKKLNTTQEEIDTLKQQREELAALYNAKKIAAVEMRLATKQKQECFKKLKDWYMGYRHIMRRVFKNNPEQLIKIGVAVKSRR